MDCGVDTLFTKLMGLGKPPQWVAAANMVLGRQDNLVKRSIFLGDNASVVVLVDELRAREGKCSWVLRGRARLFAAYPLA